MADDFPLNSNADASRFGFGRPRASFARTALAAALALFLGVWLAFALQSIAMGIDKLSAQYGWQELAEIAKAEHGQPDAANVNFLTSLGANTMKYGPFLALFGAPCLFFVFLTYKTKRPLAVIARLWPIATVFILTYMALGAIWQDAYSSQSESPVDVTSDGRWSRFWLFVVLLSVSFFIRGRLLRKEKLKLVE